MKLRIICLFLFAIQLFSVEINALAFAEFGDQKQVADMFSKNWIEDKTFGFPLQIALDSAKDKRSREIYLFIRVEDFTEKNIKKVFSGYAERYRQTEFLYISAFSNKEFLNKLIEAESSCCLFFALTPEGDKAHKQHLEMLYPPPTGYYRARLHRTPKEELIFYSPDPEKKEMIKLKLD